MSKSTFVYVTFIRTTPERLWSALTTPEFMRQYWFGMHCESDFKPGSPWKLVFADGRVAEPLRSALGGGGTVIENERIEACVAAR